MRSPLETVETVSTSFLVIHRHPDESGCSWNQTDLDDPWVTRINPGAVGFVLHSTPIYQGVNCPHPFRY